MRVTSAIRSFNGGYFSKFLQGRNDIEKYNSSCADIVGFAPTIQGPAVALSGTKFLGEVKDSSKRTWLYKFKFNATQNYILEFGHYYIRFYTDHGLIMNGASPLEVATPYSSDDLITSDGTFALSMCQSADVLYICHPNFQPRKLVRYGATNWALELFEFIGGPFKPMNDNDSVTVYASSKSGNITITASSGIFQAGHVDSLFFIKQSKANAVRQWETDKSVSEGEYRRSAGKTYKALNSGTTGTEKPIHIEGTESDGVINWQYSDRGFGVAKITGFISSTQVTAQVIDTLPINVVSSANATEKWAFAKYSHVEGWPSYVEFFRDRLVFAKDVYVDMSVAGSYQDFNERDMSGQVVADMAINLQLSTSDPIRFLLPIYSGLMVGTSGEIWTLSEITKSEPLAPSNIKAERQLESGCNMIKPLKVGNIAIFPTRTAKKIVEMGYDANVDSYGSGDLTAFATDIAANQVIALDYQAEPFSIVWAVTKTGELLGLVHSMEHKVKAWFRRELGGNGAVEDICVIPSPDNSYDEVYMIVRRTINGQSKRYIEYMVKQWDGDVDDIEAAFYVDCGLTYTGNPASQISGLTHLEGETVSVLADGKVHSDCVVSNGKIRLNWSASIVHVGLPYDAYIQTMRIEGGSQQGASMGKMKRVNKIALQFCDTACGKYGSSLNKLYSIRPLNTTRTDDKPELFSGFKVLDFVSFHSPEPYIYIKRDAPLPMTVIGIYPDYEEYDR